jgi:hypothetical protein
VADSIRVSLTASELSEVLRWTDIDIDRGFAVRTSKDRERASLTALAKFVRAQHELTGADFVPLGLTPAAVEVFVDLLDPPPVKTSKSETPKKPARARRHTRRRVSVAPRPAPAAPLPDPDDEFDAEALAGQTDRAEKIS